MMTTYHSSSNNNNGGGCGAMMAYFYQPRVLYASTFVWLTCVGGPFLAPFLKHEGNLSSAEIGTAFAIQQIFIMLASSVGGLWADYLELNVWPGRGRSIVIGFGVTMSTICFLLHGIRYIIIGIDATTNNNNSTDQVSWYNHPTYHIALQAIYGSSVSLIFPVLDGLTIAYLETQNKRQEYGKERLHGPIWWAIANLLLSPFLDKVGFIVCYPLVIATYIMFILSLIVYDTGVQHQNTATTTTTTNKISSFSPIPPTSPGDRSYDEDGNFLENDNENHKNQNHRQQQKTRENDDGNNEVDATCHTADATYYDVTTAAAAASGIFTTTSTTSTTITSQFRGDDEDSQQKQKQQPHLSMLQLFRILFISGTGAAFIVCLICVSSGQAIVDNLAFLFFENLGSSYVLLGCTVVVKIAFEIPVFYYGEYLLLRYGSNTVLVAGSICYFLNALAYTFIPFGAVKYVLLLEPLHGITYGSVQIAMVEFAAKSLPMGYEASGQGIVYFFRELGGVAGLILGGYADAIIGPRTMFRISALVVLFGTVVLVIKMILVRRSWKEEDATTMVGNSSTPFYPDKIPRIELLLSYDNNISREREGEEKDHPIQQTQEHHIELT